MGDPSAAPLQAKELFALLDQHDVHYVIVGGLAAIVHGSARATFDIDLVPDWSDANLKRLAAALRAANAQLRVPDAGPVDYPIDLESLRAFEVSTWRTRYGDLDIITGTPTLLRGRLALYPDLARRAHRREAYGITILVADLADIIESKQALARESDLAALPELHRLRDRLPGRGLDPPNQS
ncbi:MAG: hypothetical protein ACRDWA_18405 [Acidimicrobiia bacterium]